MFILLETLRNVVHTPTASSSSSIATQTEKVFEKENRSERFYLGMESHNKSYTSSITCNDEEEYSIDDGLTFLLSTLIVSYY